MNEDSFRWRLLVPTLFPHRTAETLSEFPSHGIRPLIMTPPASGLPAHSVFCRTGSTFSSWVNEGLEIALEQHDDPLVVIMNDDIEISADALTPMFEALARGAQDLVFMSGRGVMVTPSPLTPHLFGLRARTMRMPEPDGLALWWWNTDDLYHEAVREEKKIRSIPELVYSHRSSNERSDGSWRYPEEFRWSVQADHDYFWGRWAHLDMEHRGCYLSWWADALPDGQVHRTVWA